MNRSSAFLSKTLLGAARASKTARFASAKWLLQSPGVYKSLPSGFSSFRSQRLMSSQTLSDILARELAEEKEEGRDQMPQELADLKADIEQQWKIVDDGATTRMISTVGSSKVVITFHCQDSVEGTEEGYDEEGEEPAVPYRFEILVSKAGNTLVLNCISEAGEVLVDGVATSTEDIESIQASGIPRTQYQGPEFSELAEDLQEAFCEFVFSELGVNEDVAAFISMYADYKEQLEYVNFLKNAPKSLP